MNMRNGLIVALASLTIGSAFGGMDTQLSNMIAPYMHSAGEKTPREMAEDIIAISDLAAEVLYRVASGKNLPQSEDALKKALSETTGRIAELEKTHSAQLQEQVRNSLLNEFLQSSEHGQLRKTTYISAITGTLNRASRISLRNKQHCFLIFKILARGGIHLDGVQIDVSDNLKNGINKLLGREVAGSLSQITMDLPLPEKIKVEPKEEAKDLAGGYFTPRGEVEVITPEPPSTPQPGPRIEDGDAGEPEPAQPAPSRLPSPEKVKKYIPHAFLVLITLYVAAKAAHHFHGFDYIQYKLFNRPLPEQRLEKLAKEYQQTRDKEEFETRVSRYLSEDNVEAIVRTARGQFY